MLQSKYLENKNTHVFIIEKLRNFAFNLLVRQSERYFFLSSILSCLIWFQITYWGFTTQYQTGILFHFSVGNIIIVILSLFYFMALSQYFLLSDKAFFYYAYYLVFTHPVRCYLLRTGYMLCLLYIFWTSSVRNPMLRKK